MRQKVTGVAGAWVSSMCQSPSASCSFRRRTQPTTVNTLSSRPARGAHQSLLVRPRGAHAARIRAMSTGVTGRVSSVVSTFSLQR